MTRQYEHEDDRFDATLRRHFASDLDAQLGRSRRAFDAHLAATCPPSAQMSRGPLRSRIWVIGVVGSALAASLAALWAVPIMRTGSTTSMATPPAPSSLSHPPHSPVVASAMNPVPGLAAGQWEQVGSVTNSVSEYGGVVLIGDDTPARVVRQLETVRTQWVDTARGVRVEIEVPRQTTKLIELDTH